MWWKSECVVPIDTFMYIFCLKHYLKNLDLLAVKTFESREWMEML